MDIRTRRRNADEAIRLDQDGNWYHGEYPILHDRTVQFLHKNITIDDSGQYYLTGEDKPVYFTVEDAPYFIKQIETTIVGFLITLTDDSIELLDVQNLWTGKNNALYCLVKGGSVPAKFTRACYNEIAKTIEKVGNQFCLFFGNKKYPIQTSTPKRLTEQRKKIAKLKKDKEKAEKKKRKLASRKNKPIPPPQKKSIANKAAKKKAAEENSAKKPAPKKAAKKRPAANKKPSKSKTKKR